MKTRVLIIENNYCKFFAAKQVLESQLKMKLDVVSTDSVNDLVEKTLKLSPDQIIFCPTGGIVELLTQMKKRRTNRRNTEISIMLAENVDQSFGNPVEQFVNHYLRSPDNFADVA